MKSPLDAICKPSIDDSETVTAYRVDRTGLAAFLFAFLRPRHASAAAIDTNALRLEYRFRISEISLGNIMSVEVKSGWIWAGLRIRNANGNTAVSGLSPDDIRVFVEALEIARARWWQRTLAPQIGMLRSVYDALVQLADPPAYLARSSFAELQRTAERATEQFVACWPNTLQDTPEIRMLRAILDFREDPDRFLREANATFVANELTRSQEWFDQIEAQPLTAEQRKAVIVNEDHNLVIAAAGSGKTSVIVAKAGWLLHRGFRRPSELLLLAFARNARKEMEERICKRLGGDMASGIKVSTFHSLGLAIIGTVEGKRPALTKAVEDERVLIGLLKEIVAELINDRNISETILTWFREQFAPYRSQHEFKTWGAYFDYIRRYEIRSLKGEKVKSFEECEIANFLYLNNVDYEYERLYEQETGSSEKWPYRPDFYLPDTGIWIEHFGINAMGKTAPYVPQDEYLKSMAWKKELHKKHGTTLVETFSHECAAGTLLRKLEANLRSHGVNLYPMSSTLAFATLEKQGLIDPFLCLVATFLKHFKGARLSFEDTMQRATKMGDRVRAKAFLAVFRPIFDRYQETLARTGQIDFHDMIARATEHVEAGRYRSPYGYILVDEFQDISPDRARLLKALLDCSPGAQLFGVGDDWQSIFRFAGSDIGIMQEFPERFGDCERLFLETTFRCADRIAAVATDFILRNPMQIPKTVRSTNRADSQCIHVGLPGDQKLSLLKEALNRIAADASKYDEISTVLLLGRYSHLQRNMSGLAQQYPSLRVTYKTVHGSKGLEADYVVVLGMISAKHGFPSEISDDPLLDLVLSEPEAHPNAEERRLLYVAITRARRHVFLLAEGGPPSSFATELIGSGYDVAVFGRPPVRDVSCPVCIEGRIMRRENSRNGGIFYGCSNYPYCEHRQRPCPACLEGLPVKERGKFKCRDCEHSIEACPDCDGWLVISMGKYGRFIGCTSYPNCRYTRNFLSKGPRNEIAGKNSNFG